ncbi:hypothetical protein DMENIID0001_019630 [Sergentomyia squamirostris]
MFTISWHSEHWWDLCDHLRDVRTVGESVILDRETTASRLCPSKSIAQSRLTVGSYIPFLLGGARASEHTVSFWCLLLAVAKSSSSAGATDDALACGKWKNFFAQEEVAKVSKAPHHSSSRDVHRGPLVICARVIIVGRQCIKALGAIEHLILGRDLL